MSQKTDDANDAALAAQEPMDARSRKLVMTSAVFVLTGLATLGIYTWPRIDETLEIYAHSEALRAEVDSSRQSNNRRKARVLKGTAAYQSILDTLSVMIPDTSEVPALIDSVQRIAKRGGVAVTLISPMPDRPDSLFTAHPVRVRLSGPFTATLQSITNMASMTRVLAPVSLSVTPVSRGATRSGLNGLTDVDVVVETYTVPTTEERARWAAANAKDKPARRRSGGS